MRRRVDMRLPEELLAEIDEIARQLDLTRTAVTVMAYELFLAWQQQATNDPAPEGE